MTLDLVVIGLSHRQAPVGLRERLAVVPAEIEAYLQTLVAGCGVQEAALISTCNRVEIYAAAPDAAAAVAALRRHLRVQVGDVAEATDVDRHLFHHDGRAAFSHLFRVAASLDSLVVGEPQILGQVKDAFETALRAGTAGPLLRGVFQRAFRVARKVRRDTAIAENPVSVSSVAVDLARQVWETFAGLRVLLIGAGEMADLAARALRADGAAVAVTNRTRARAEELAGRLGCEVEPFERLDEALARADIVITSTGSREPILREPTLRQVQRARRGKPLVVIDIAVPRDVDPAVGKLAGVLLFDIDALQEVVSGNMQDRRKEAERAEVLVEEELNRFLEAGRGRAVGPTIAAVRAKMQNVARAEADRAIAALGAADDEKVRRALQQMADSIVNKLAHTPSTVLKKDAASADGAWLVQAVHRLFDLPPIESVAPEDAETDDGAEDAASPDRAPGEAVTRAKAARS